MTGCKDLCPTDPQTPVCLQPPHQQSNKILGLTNLLGLQLHQKQTKKTKRCTKARMRWADSGVLPQTCSHRQSLFQNVWCHEEWRLSTPKCWELELNLTKAPNSAEVAGVNMHPLSKVLPEPPIFTLHETKKKHNPRDNPHSILPFWRGTKPSFPLCRVKRSFH